MSSPKKRLRFTPELVLNAYRLGYFPMAESREGPLSWYSPDPRAIIPLETFRPARSLRRTCAKGIFDLHVDSAFGEVMRLCAEREETWISDEIIDVYTQLHTLGFAHSVESWRNGRLSGGLYGVSISGAFFGESMFSRETDSSKVALVFLVEKLKHQGFLLLDAQFLTPHLQSLGALTISREEYLQLLEQALTVDTSFPGF